MREEAIIKRDEHLDTVVHAINTLTEALRSSFLEKQTFQEAPEVAGILEDCEWDLRLASQEEMRELTRESVLPDQEERILQTKILRYAVVLRRRFQDKSLRMKLHVKWDGPYLRILRARLLEGTHPVVHIAYMHHKWPLAAQFLARKILFHSGFR